MTRLLMLATFLGSNEPVPETTTSWHYAAWVSLDLRLLLFSVLFAGLVSAALTALLLKSERRLDYVSCWFLAFISLLLTTICVMNLISAHPVFVVESFFPFP